MRASIPDIINPITEFREEHKLQQKELAEYAEVSPQVILRAEQGLYNSLPPSIASAVGLLDLQAAFTIAEDYRKWQVVVLELTKPLIKELMPLTYAGTKNEIGIGTFVDWRYCFSDSVTGFCKIFKIQQAIVSKYEAGHMDNLPVIIEERLKFFGYGFVAEILKGLPVR